MALVDQPYLPLYVDDWMNNSKLKECSLAANGLMITIMCLMHKSNDGYGKILLKQKYKQTDKQISNFAKQLAKQFAFSASDIESHLEELINEKVLFIEDSVLICKRMVKDSNLSITRATIGREGGLKNASNLAKQFALAKTVANTGNGIDIGIENGIEGGNKVKSDGIYSLAENSFFEKCSKRIVEILSRKIDLSKSLRNKPVDNPTAIRGLIEKDGQAINKVEQIIDYLDYRDDTSKYAVVITSIDDFRHKFEKLYTERERWLLNFNEEKKSFKFHDTLRKMFIFNFHNIEKEQMEVFKRNATIENFKIVYLEPHIESELKTAQ